jgi:hypothetical protein
VRPSPLDSPLSLGRLFEERETLSKQSRLELLKGDTAKFIRMVQSRPCASGGRCTD